RWDRFLEVQFKGEYFERKSSNFLGLANDALCLLCANNLCRIDRSYLIPLHPFFHALVIMIFDRATSFFVYWVFSLFGRTGKTLNLCVFYEIIAMLDWVWEPEAIVCDFEQELLKVV
ncbi:hypothetical protein MXB_3194, partial [Myxobolus squamalis]